MLEITLTDLISNVGFPIAITCYFIFKVEKVIVNNTKALTQFYEVSKNCGGKNSYKN